MVWLVGAAATAGTVLLVVVAETTGGGSGIVFFWSSCSVGTASSAWIRVAFSNTGISKRVVLLRVRDAGDGCPAEMDDEGSRRNTERIAALPPLLRGGDARASFLFLEEEDKDGKGQHHAAECGGC